MRLWTREHLKSENGNALLMALSVIMVLTAFGTASLMTSVANIHMSTKYRNWSKDYYTLDMNAEDKVNQLNTLLQTAEKDAQDYMAGQYYLYSDTDLDPTSIPPVNLRVPSYAQSYIHTKWVNDVAPNMQDLNNPDYQTKLTNFLHDTVQRLYYYYASQLLSPGGYTSATYLNVPTASLGNYQAELFNADALLDGTSEHVLSAGNLVVDINSAATINAINPIDPNSVMGKSVAVKVDVRFPTYEEQTQTKNIPIQGNPVWANAITAEGNIGFVGAGTSTINGDIFSADSSEPLPINDNVVTDNGIYSQGANVEINGNVYSKGNLHIIGNDSTINVHGYSNSTVPIDIRMKDNIFSQNKLYFDLAAAGSIPVGSVTDYIQGSTRAGETPMVYKDVNGGNVYCNSLAVEGSYPNHLDQTVSNGKINVDGNVTNYNDIRMDGLKSEITVAENDIGINSTPDSSGDPNASSSVINNTPLTPSAESSITLKGNFIVPGTAFAKYNGVKKAGDSLFTWNNSTYYQTGESISASNANIFSAYMAAVINPDNTNYNYYYDQYTNNLETTPEAEIHSYYFMRREVKGSPGPDVSQWKTQQLVNFLSGKSVVTNLISGSSVNGYSLGAALLQKPGVSSATVYAFDSLDQDYLNYHNFKDCLAKIFKAKTQQLGTVDKSASSFDGVFVNSGAIFKGGTLITERGVNDSPTSTPDSFVYSQEALTTLDLNLGDKSGIIYCTGNLNITGNGTFKGAIICEGNVTVSGNPMITYDEGAIITTLKSSSNIRNFFAPGNMGGVTYISYLDVPSYDGAVRTDAIRYKILEWREKQQ